MSESRLWLVRDTRTARNQGRAALQQRQQARFADMVAFARAHSPYYQDLYKDLPDHITDPTLLPVTSKKTLMPHFNDWVTDRTVTLEKAQAFVNNPANIAGLFLGKYLGLTTSGTSGTVGIFVKDERETTVTSALSLRMLSDWLTAGEILRIVARGLRMAMIFAVDRPVASFTAATHLSQKVNRFLKHGIGTFSVHDPMPTLIEQLNHFRPAMISSYARTMSLLADEQKAGRLHIDPVFITITAEGLPLDEYDRIAGVFNTKVRNGYASTECPFLSYSCAHGWLHVNTDWAVFEPVDRDLRPTPKGTQSHTVLISNLANRVQPILRYDLGDSILERPDPCPCGNPLPAIRVQGRTTDILTFPSRQGEPVHITPLVLSTLIVHIPGIDLFQIVQTTPTHLRIHLRYVTGTDPAHVWQEVQGTLAHFLANQQLVHVTLEQATEPPQQSAGGKYREVIPLKEGS